MPLSRTLLITLGILVVGSGCKAPEEKLAEHAEAITSILKDNVEKPEDGLTATREYLHENLPEMNRLFAELVVEFDGLEDASDRKDRLKEVISALETPMKDLMRATKAFGKAARKDEAAMDLVEEIGKSYEKMAARVSEKATTLQAFTRYQNRAKTTEAIDQLDKIYKSAANYYTAPRVERGTGRKLACQFPRNQSLTPDVSNKRCCGGALDGDGDNRCDVNTSAWTTATWSALNFQIYNQHYFGYAFQSSGTGPNAKFTASAHADLDCDGTLSTFERYGYGDASASMAECSMKGSSAFYKDKETE